MDKMSRSKWYQIGKDRGINSALDAYPRTDWKSREESQRIAQDIKKGYEDGDQRIFDFQPSPLSGEWAGESMMEIFGRYPTEAMMNNYETGFSDGFWGKILEKCEEVIANE
jgi:hypothetical protein